MSALTLLQNFTAIAPSIQASFGASGGTSPYTYSVRPGGAGGTIDASTGMYTAPAVMNLGRYDVENWLYDTVQVVDHVGATATAKILVGSPLLLFCDIIQTYMNLAPGRVYLWDQKIMQPTDAGVYVAVSVLSCKPFASINVPDGSGSALNSGQTVSMYAQMQVDVISRDAEARDRKEEVILALDSDYSRSQQAANTFGIGKLPPGSQFLNLSSPDGAAIPYRFNIAVAMQYVFRKTVATPYFDTFSTPQVVSNS